MALLRLVLLLGLCGGLGFGCEDALVPASFEGTPVYTHPNFSIHSVGPVTAQRPRWAIFWLPTGLDPDGDFATQGVEQVETSRSLALFVGTLTLFARPGLDLLAEAPSGARYGIGRIMAYDDLDGDRRRDPDEPFLGAERYGIAYAPSLIAAADSPTGRDIVAGYHRLQFDLPCGKTLDGTDMDCTVPVGIACRDSGDCGDGECLRTVEPGFPNGMCGAIESNDCAPPGSVLYRRPSPDGVTDIYAWIAACRTSADCRTSDGYHCDVLVGGCLRDRGHEMYLEDLPRDVICKRDGPDMGPEPEPPEMEPPPDRPVDCETNADCVDAPGPQPQHCDPMNHCRPD